MKQIDLNIILCDYTNTAHLEAVCNLMNAYIEDRMGGGEPLTRRQQLYLVDGLEQHPTSIVLLAEHQGVFCGLLVAFELFSTFTVRPMINVHDLIVLPEFRRKGAGRLLLERVIAIGEEKNCSRISLEVRMDNINAQELYKKLGFGEAEPPMYYWRKKLNG
jgi:ribosomal protein S18 acetylase RimI-like enzyme